MKTILSSLLLALSLGQLSSGLRELEYGFCTPDTHQPITIEAASIDPYPVVVHSGATIAFEVALTLLEVVPEGATVSLKIVKEGLIDLPIPCLEIQGLHLGSCDYAGQDLLDFGAAVLCPTYFPPGQECALPLNPGKYGGGDPLVLTLPDIPDILVDFLAAGTYKVTAEVNLPDGSEMTCLYVRLEITNE